MKTCEECKYYMQHYSIFDGKIRKVFCGHCCKTKANGRYRKTDKPCEEYLQRDKTQIKENKKKIVFSYLRAINKQLNDINVYLQKEN